MTEQQNVDRAIIDHDLLIQIGTKLDRALLDIKELKDNLASRVGELETEKMDKAEAERLFSDVQTVHEDHEKRIRTIEVKHTEYNTKLRTWGTVIGVAATVAGFLLNFVVNAYFKIFAK